MIEDLGTRPSRQDFERANQNAEKTLRQLKVFKKEINLEIKALEDAGKDDLSEALIDTALKTPVVARDNALGLIQSLKEKQAVQTTKDFKQALSDGRPAGAPKEQPEPDKPDQDGEMNFK